MQAELHGVIEYIDEISEDSTLPQAIRAKLSHIKVMLQSSNEDISITINRVLDIIEEIAEDVNIPSYARMELMNISSLLAAMPAQ